MLYLLNINFIKPDFVPKQDLYYAILWWFLNMFKNYNEIYKSIIKLSFSIYTNFTIHLTIQWEENYNLVVNQLLQKQNEIISINNNKFSLKQIRFDFKLFDEKKIKIFPMKQWTIYFQSPTRIKNKNINHQLPLPEKFIFSSFQKLQKTFWRKLDDKDFKSRLKYNIYIWEFDLHTQQVTIKKAKHSGVVGYCKYYCKDIESVFNKYLCMTLQAMRFVWVWSGIKLWLWNVGVKW